MGYVFVEVNDMKDAEYLKIEKEINRLEKQISEYPIGSISKKMINGKEKYYHQWYELGKTRSRYLKEDEVEKLRAEIELRKAAQKELNELKKALANISGTEKSESLFNKKLSAGITIPLEITGMFNGKYIIPDKDIRPKAGQKIIVTIRDITRSKTEVDLDKYINKGEKLFKKDAQEYIREIRDEERF